MFEKSYYPPSYLEPKPQFVVEPTSNLLFPLHLFTILKETFYSPTTHVQIPIPRRRSSSSSFATRTGAIGTTIGTHTGHLHRLPVESRIISPSPSSSSSTSSSTTNTTMDPMSPTMTAASASAAAAADHRNPGSHVAKSLLKSISTETNPYPTHTNRKRLSDVMYHHTVVHHKKAKPNVDQSMFLTKNAHIKRPRNAWIHVSFFFFFF